MVEYAGSVTDPETGVLVSRPRVAEVPFIAFAAQAN